jgi:hypothetical protein
MTTTSEHNQGPASLLGALDGMTNRRALLMLVASTIVALGIGALAGVLFAQYASWSNVLGQVLVLVAMLVLLTGFSASGLLLMDQARGVEIRGMIDAFLAALFTLPKVLGVLFTQGVLLLVLLLGVALLLFVCKIPGIGPVLYAVVFPVSAAITGIMLAGLFYVWTSLALPSIWQGCTYRETIARLWAITRMRLTFVMLMLLALSFLTFFTSSIVGGITFAGISMVGLLSSQIIGFGGSFSFSSLMSIFGGGMGEGGHMAAGMFGAAVLVAAASALCAMVFVKGLCHIYLSACDGLDFSQAERELQARTEQLRKKAEAAQQRARAAAEASRASAMTPAPAAASQASAGCPQCHAPASAGDRFCEHCGHSLG